MFENKKVGGIGGGALNKSVTIELESQKLAPRLLDLGCWARANTRPRDFRPSARGLISLDRAGQFQNSAGWPSARKNDRGQSDFFRHPGTQFHLLNSGPLYHIKVLKY